MDELKAVNRVTTVKAAVNVCLLHQQKNRGDPVNTVLPVNLQG
jgi:hypothetical protein